MRVPVIPLFAGNPSHPFVPLWRRTASAHSEGQGRPPAGACALPLTAARTLAGWSHRGGRVAWCCAVLLLAGALSVCVESGVAVAQTAPVERPAAAHPYAAHIAEASQRFGIPEHWIAAVLRAESAGDVGAVSSAGAMGLMQVMPDTWAGLRVRHGLDRDPYDPRDNIMAGTAYLREMWDSYGNVGAMLAAYNAGPGRYDEHRATGRPLPAETRAYVAALAPILGGATPSDAPSRQPAPSPDWRDAPLFVQRPDGSQSTVAPSSDAQSGDLFAAVSERDRP
ncbi:lytic transglycosylase domain-containing protein [Brucella intermedia]|uniref:lytic transglycosylase domain-containing protein n=1 Tax=Brucella intermedia TaxID=94625 RepID=UPI00124DFBD0|nr:lytic transglycosylase domain-containing protein [Brucella intermedia]